MSLISFLQGKPSHGLGERRASQAVEHASPEILSKGKFHRTLEEAAWKPVMIG